MSKLSVENKYKLSFIIPIIIILCSLIRPIYYSVMYPDVVNVTVVGTTTIEDEVYGKKETQEVTLYEYEYKGKIYKQPLYLQKDIDPGYYPSISKVGTKDKARVHKNDPTRITKHIIVDFADIMILLAGLSFLLPLILAKKEIIKILEESPSNKAA